MSTIDTPFKVGETYKNGLGNDVKIVAIVPESVFPVWGKEKGSERPATYTIDGKMHMGDVSAWDLIPPKTLPPLPERREWHRPEAVTQAMIDEGFRPLIKGELIGADCDYEDDFNGGTGWGPCTVFVEVTKRNMENYRTKRPLPPQKKRIPLGPEDVPPGSVFRSKEWTFKGGFWSPSKVARDGILFAQASYFHYSGMMETWEILRPGGKWSPMWKEVDA
jgi:hypothetical protein